MSEVELDNQEEALPTEEMEVFEEVDLSKVKQVTHNFVDRGVFYSCETGTHECHKVYKRLPMQ